MNVEISIITPLYNKERYISETVKSVINQQFINWELIIIDDGSTDGSVSKLEEFNDPRIRYIKREDYQAKKGASICRNIGIGLSRGELIMFLDADDVILPHCLEYRYEVASKKRGVDLIVFKEGYFKYDQSNFLRKSKVKDLVFSFFSLSQRRFFFKRFASYDLPWTISNPLWNKAYLEKLGGFNENFQRLQDPELHTRALYRSDLKMLSFLFYKPDVLIRIEEDRRSVDPTQHLINHLNAVYDYIFYFSKFYEKEGVKRNLVLLQGYGLSAEQSFLYWKIKLQLSDNRASIKMGKIRELLTEYGIYTEGYAKFAILIEKIMNQKFLSALKCHSILIKLYKVYLCL